MLVLAVSEVFLVWNMAYSVMDVKKLGKLLIYNSLRLQLHHSNRDMGSFSSL